MHASNSRSFSQSSTQQNSSFSSTEHSNFGSIIPNISFEAISNLFNVHLLEPLCQLYLLKYNQTSAVYIAETTTHSEYILYLWSNVWYASSVVENTVAAMRLVREHSTIPVPHISFYNSDPLEIGAPYVVMQRMQGIPIDRVWNGMTAAQKDFVAKQLAEFTIQLQALEFTSIGSLWQTGNMRLMLDEQAKALNKATYSMPMTARPSSLSPPKSKLKKIIKKVAKKFRGEKKNVKNEPTTSPEEALERPQPILTWAEILEQASKEGEALMRKEALEVESIRSIPSVSDNENNAIQVGWSTHPLFAIPGKPPYQYERGLGPFVQGSEFLAIALDYNLSVLERDGLLPNPDVMQGLYVLFCHLIGEKRPLLLKKGPIFLVHGNLNSHNILVDSFAQITGIVGWSHAGAYPSWVEWNSSFKFFREVSVDASEAEKAEAMRRWGWFRNEIGKINREYICDSDDGRIGNMLYSLITGLCLSSQEETKRKLVDILAILGYWPTIERIR